MSAILRILQYRHYKACLEIFKLSPSKESREFSDLVGFVAQVSACRGSAHSSLALMRCPIFPGQPSTETHRGFNVLPAAHFHGKAEPTTG